MYGRFIIPDMSRNAGEILKEALALPSETRAALADSLWDSLDPEVDADAEDAWRKEIQGRLAELQSGPGSPASPVLACWGGGAVAAIPWSEARSRLLAKLLK